MKEKAVTPQQLRSDRHYVLPVSLHDTSPTPGSRRIRAPRRPLTLPSLTFDELKRCMSERSRSGTGVSPSSLPNALSALTQFMEERGYTDADCVGTHLRASYYKDKAVAAHAQSLHDEHRPAEYIRNRKALLKRWRQLLLELDRSAAAQNASETPFQRALHELFDGAPPVKTITTRLGVPYATIKRWLAGSLPQRKAVRHVQVLERFFGQPPGTLTDLLSPGVAPVNVASIGLPPHQKIPYRARLAEQVKLEYALKDVNPSLRAEWARLVAHKTSLHASGLKRQKRGKWAVTQRAVHRGDAIPWYASVSALGKGTMSCQTASMNWGRVSQYLGWLILDQELGGAGVPAEQAQTLLWLTELEFLRNYVEWRVARSGGVLHQGITSFLKLVASLCHGKTGYLTQSRERFAGHADAVCQASWERRCQLAFEQAREVNEQITDSVEASRDPEAPIAYILSLPNPLSAVSDAVARMDSARPSTGGEAEAVWARDRLMVKLLASNPLRAKNLKLLTISPTDEEAQLRKVNGEWRIAIDKKDFKNLSGAAKDRIYDMPVRKEVWNDLEMYLRLYRPQLADPTNPYLFVSSDRPATLMYGLNRRFEVITRRFFPQCPGVGPHAMRHIVATTILKLHPNAWAAAAFVLHDREETVRQHYAHLCSADAARWLEDVMTKAMSGF